MVRGQVLHAGTFITAVAPRFTAGARLFVLSVVANVGCCLRVDGLDWHLQPLGRR